MASWQWYRCLVVITLVSKFWQLSISVVAQTAPISKSTEIVNTATYSYTNPYSRSRVSGSTNQLTQSLIDPLGQITGCKKEVLSDYRGFSVGLYSASASGLDLNGIEPLTPTEVPDVSGNRIPPGMAPNQQNSNPYFLKDDGKYSFVFDESRGQLNVGRTYILVVNPPSGSTYAQRRIKLVITSRAGNTVSYSATPLDGKSINLNDDLITVDSTLTIMDAQQVGLMLAIVNISISICDAQDIQITKSGDRVSAEPGDTVIYHLAVKNPSSTALTNIIITDILPLGLSFIPNSVRGELAGNSLPLTTTQSGSTVVFKADGVNLLPNKTNPNHILNIAYAVRLTPDAIRSSGQNSAMIAAQRADNLQPAKDGPAVHRLRIRPGILSDCGTIIGRVFEDKNFDGEQQLGEPGIAGAVIFMDDGNRIITDAKGMFSVANVIAGHRTGVLDLTSVPGYKLAPNHYFNERNSQSRLVNLEPGGLVRMNFAVTPTF